MDIFTGKADILTNADMKNRHVVGVRGGRWTAMMSRQKLLFAENDQQVIKTLGMYLESVECQPVFVGDGEKILNELSETDGKQAYKAVVLDTRIREMDINQMIRQIRERSGIPIIILAPESEVTDRILALNLGADDYITEPVNPMEFAVRVRAGMRRFTGGIHFANASAGNAEKEDLLTIGRLTLDTKTLTLYKDETEISLTPIEYKIMYRLMKEPGKICAKEDLCALMNEPSGGRYENAIMVHISHLRAKIEDAPHRPVYIKNVRGLGYKIENR